MELVAATRNKDKLREIKELLKGLKVDVFSLDSFKDAPEVIEDGKTLKDNAVKKAIEVSKFLKCLAVADDSGLEVEYLNGEPGVYSARFSGKNATYKSNNEKLLNLLKNAPPEKRNACFKCVIAVADKGKVIGVAEGKCEGKIGLESKGENGFGYDPVFTPAGYKKTFAEMGPGEKNKISHRSMALAQARKIIAAYLSPCL
ncbi:MAG: XTP/dITP diphosphatase [Candidatus Omnitrophota bacterium]|nr:XTP/dITP diphosphatase [Candidatus Omnitrophota bacterium]